MHLQQMQDCITSCFSEESEDPRESMRCYAIYKAQAHRILEDFLENS